MSFLTIDMKIKAISGLLYLVPRDELDALILRLIKIAHPPSKELDRSKSNDDKGIIQKNITHRTAIEVDGVSYKSKRAFCMKFKVSASDYQMICRATDDEANKMMVAIQGVRNQPSKIDLGVPEND